MNKDVTVKEYYREYRKKNPQIKEIKKFQYRDSHKDEILKKCDEFLDYFGYKKIEK